VDDFLQEVTALNGSGQGLFMAERCRPQLSQDQSEAQAAPRTRKPISNLHVQKQYLAWRAHVQTISTA